MMYIEGHWETINTLQDISKIVREHYNYELADEMDELIESTSTSHYDSDRLEELEDIIEQIRSIVY